MAATDDYKFLPIRDAITSINQKVNLIGVILEFGFPKRTRGTDCCCTLKIIDESHQKAGFSVNIFAEYLEMLPHVASGGDIIQLCHVMVKKHIGEVNAVFNKKFSSFALYKGKDAADFAPYQVSSNFRRRDMDDRFIGNLRKWLVDLQLHEESSSFSLLREIKEGEHINLACKIVHFSEAAKDEWMALVWDGTDTPPNSFSAKPEDEMAYPLPLQLENSPLPRDILCTFPKVGTVLRIYFDQGFQKNKLFMLNIGKWIKFVNVICEVRGGLWCGLFTPFTKIRYTPDEDCLILERQRLYDERISLKWGRMPLWSFPSPYYNTEVNYDHVPFVSLMDVLTHSEVTAKFKCVVRVIAAIPWKAEEFLSPLGIYRMRLTLEDPTARIHAFVFAEDGETLFDGYPSVDVLSRKLNRLLGLSVCNDNKMVKDAPRNPPWVQVCLKSYYISKDDVWGSRQYQIFGTKIVGV
ncbi:Protection of telomeres protein [Quillaja saponaria]|uniref:Protection of telomeres protein n=1 Tax=Quillaja saponaria TaxID=32244 RepID=A0AAD7M5R6_QUISA|nr:Protection of telomeres protein [Quillaja saponaria]